MFIQHTLCKALPSTSLLCTHFPTGPEKQKIQAGLCPKPHIWSCSLEDKDTAHLVAPLACPRYSGRAWTSCAPQGDAEQQHSCGCHPAVPYSWSHLTQQPLRASRKIQNSDSSEQERDTFSLLTFATCSVRNHSWQPAERCCDTAHELPAGTAGFYSPGSPQGQAGGW